jgi:hypothetical protein
MIHKLEAIKRVNNNVAIEPLPIVFFTIMIRRESLRTLSMCHCALVRKEKHLFWVGLTALYDLT